MQVSVHEAKTNLSKFLEVIVQTDGHEILPLYGSLALKASLLDWPHRDPFDRIIAASALHEGLPLVSSDCVFDDIGVQRLWDA